MSSIEDLANKALTALREERPKDARELLARAIAEAPERLDLRHALAITHLQLGETMDALYRIEEVEDMAREIADEAAAALMSQIVLTRASVHEELAQPAEAEAAYREVLENEEGNPSALQGLGFLLCAWGRIDEGVPCIEAFAEAMEDSPEVAAGANAFLDALRKFRRDDVHPREFLVAHRGSYCEFFDHHARQMAGKGWIAEAARMRRDHEGRVVPSIPEGARPYAAVRVDLVDPSTGQVGLVGDEPMLVSIAGYEPLAHAPTLFPAPPDRFKVWISSQSPWNHLVVQLRFERAGAQDDADRVIGDWYRAGWDGNFGSHEAGRFHQISDPESPAPDALAYNLDCGRAEVTAIDDLLRRLAILHDRHPIRHVVIGRGYLPK